MEKKTFTLLCIFSLIAVIVYSRAKIPHDFDNTQCTICHTGPNKKVKFQKSSSVTQKCLTCHTTLYDEGYMHPVDIKPKKVSLPLDFPLSNSGEITCNTCHDPHAPYETPFGEKSHFLRRLEKGKAFCDICHVNSLSIAAGHQTVFRKAHFGSTYTEDPNSMEAIDMLSKNCLSCHDGASGSSVEVKAGKWQHSKNFIKFDKGGMHPIGMSYEKTRMENFKASLRPIGEVDKRIRFFGRKNKIGCGSCHDPFSPKSQKLVMSNEQSRLCFSCHQM